MQRFLLLLVVFAGASFVAPAAPQVSTPAPAAPPSAPPAVASTPDARTQTPATSGAVTPQQTPEAEPTQPPTPINADAPFAASTESAPARLAADRAAPVRVPRLQTPPVIDGRLDDAAWQEAAVFEDFLQTQPGDNIAPSQPTRVWLGYDARHLYIAFRAYDNPANVRATVARRDQIFNDDTVRVILDTFNDQRRAYIFAFNPLGIQADGILTEGRGEDYSLDLVFESKGVIDEQGYTVEAAIPFRALRYEAGRDRVWGLHLFRRIKHANNEQNSWMPIARGRSGLLNQAGRITGLEGIAIERTLEIVPSLTVSQTGRRARALSLPDRAANPSLIDQGQFVNDRLAFDPGVTVKFGISPTLTLDFALNPDFAQVEADQTVVTANQRFPIFFAEKRAFFLEGIDIFQTPLTAVHTRAIVDPDFAGKLTGRRGPYTFGLLAASDAGPGNFSEEERQDPRNARFFGRNATIGILRLRRNVGRESNLGLVATSYNFIERHNYLGGFDGRFSVNPQTVFTFQVLGTHSRRLFFEPELNRRVYRTGNGFAYLWNYDHTGRNFGYVLRGEGRTRDYRADAGFTPRTNTNRQDAFVRFSNDPNPNRTLISWRFVQSASISYDWQGRSQRWELRPELSLNFARQTSVGLSYSRAYERLFEEKFGARRSATQRGAFFGPDPERSAYRHGFSIEANTTPSRTYSFGAGMVYRMGVFDLDFGAGPRFPRVSPAALANPRAPLDPGPGNLFEFGAGASYQPTAALNTSLNYTRSRLVRRDTGLVAYDDNIITWRATYQFTPFVALRTRLDYTTLSTRARAQFLFAYTPSPGTALYIGYNDDINRNGFNPFTGHYEPGFRRNGRTFFIKMSYLFRRSF